MKNEALVRIFGWIRRHKVLTVFIGLVGMGLISALGNAQKAVENPLPPSVTVQQVQESERPVEESFSPTPSPTPAPYTLLEREKSEKFESIFYLVPADLSDQEAGAMAREIKQAKCSLP